MPNWFYYDNNGQKQGPISNAQLKQLAVQGVVVPETPLETDSGHKGKAGQIKGLFTLPAATASPAAARPQTARPVNVPPVNPQTTGRNGLPVQAYLITGCVLAGVILILSLAAVFRSNDGNNADNNADNDAAANAGNNGTANTRATDKQHDFTYHPDVAYRTGYYVDKIEFSPDGKLAVTVAYKEPLSTIYKEPLSTIYDAATGKEIAKLGERFDCFSPDGKRAVTRDYDKKISWIYDTATWKEIAKLEGEFDRFSLDGKRAATSDSDKKTSWIYDTATWKEIAKLEGKYPRFSPDGKRVITHDDKTTSWIYDTATWKEIAKLEGKFPHFSPDGKRVVMEDTTCCYVYDAATGQEIAKWKGRWTRFSPDGKRAVTEYDDKDKDTSLIYDTATGKEIAKLEGISYINIFFLPDGRIGTKNAMGYDAAIWKDITTLQAGNNENNERKRAEERQKEKEKMMAAEKRNKALQELNALDDIIVVQENLDRWMSSITREWDKGLEHGIDFASQIVRLWSNGADGLNFDRDIQRIQGKIKKLNKQQYAKTLECYAILTQYYHAIKNPRGSYISYSAKLETYRNDFQKALALARLEW